MRQGVQEHQGPSMQAPKVEAPKMNAPEMNAPPANAPEPAAQPEMQHPEAALPPQMQFHFGTGSTVLTPDSRNSVDELVSFMRANPTSRIRITGFADTTGNAGANEALSESRASSLKSTLVGDGIAGSRIETSGMGDSHPVASNDNDSDRAQNRRAEVTLAK
jgi:outer membrane protein OmpA-like peptidoglycan-associated protein